MKATQDVPITPERVRYAMMIHDISGADLARAIGIHPDVLSRILRGRDARAQARLPDLYESVLHEAVARIAKAPAVARIADPVRYRADLTLADLDDPDASGQDP